MTRLIVLICGLSIAVFTAWILYINANKHALDLIQGKWELDPILGESRGSFVCNDKPLIIKIDKTNLRIKIGRGDKIKEGKILLPKKGSFWVKYDNEEIIEDNGYPVGWVFILVDRNSFGQIRTDWLDENFDVTKKVAKRVRCGWL